MRVLRIATLIGGLLMTGLAQATLVNPGFEAGFTGWNTTGQTTVSGFANEGTASANLVAGTTAIGSVESSLGLTAGSIDAATADGTNGTGKPTDGAAIWQSTTASNGEVFEFAWYHVDNDGAGWNDTSIAALVTPTSQQIITLGDGSLNFGTSGWMTGSLTAPEAGSATLGFVMFNQGDTSVDSEVFVDSTSVPAPGVLSLLAMGLVGLGLGRRGKPVAPV